MEPAQDDIVYDKKEMPLDAYLNSEADELATTELERIQNGHTIPYRRENYNKIL